MAEWFWKKKGLQTAALVVILVLLVLLSLYIGYSTWFEKHDDPVEIIVRRNDQYGTKDNNYALVEAYRLNQPGT